MAAAGRGEFYRYLEEGLWKTEGQQTRVRGRGKPGSKGKMHKHKPRPTESQSTPAPIPHKTPTVKKWDTRSKSPKGRQAQIERLPSEILTKILSYLDPSSLYFISLVNKLFCRLANDDVLWHNIYMSEFGKNQLWRTKSDVYTRLKVTSSSVGNWKQMYFKALAGHKVKKWRRDLRDINPYTGLPKQTEWVLRNLNVVWQLKVKDCVGLEICLEPSKVTFFETSVVIQWNTKSLPNFKQISSIQLYGVRNDIQRVKKPDWPSLISRMNMMLEHASLIGKDRLIQLFYLSPSFIVGFWRGQTTIAFIMVCLHFHKLVERSLLGSPVCPYEAPMETLPLDKSDPEYGLRGYSLHFVLHNTTMVIMSGYFPNLCCRTVYPKRDQMMLSVISTKNLSHHRSLSGRIRLPWKTEELEGSIENCCIMTLTLLDEFQKPFWCVSAPVHITRAKSSLSMDYNGDHCVIDYSTSEGKVKMKLVWLHEEKQFFLIGLSLCVSINKINKYFSTHY